MFAGSSSQIKLRVILLAASLVALITSVAGAPAQGPVPPSPPPPPDEPPFILPLAGDPGMSTWYVIQWYGNTTFAYHWRDTYYNAGQGLHFGLDLSAPCGTEVHAIGDGIVAHVDYSRFGSGPHNIMIDHENGFSSLYGHLLERPRVGVGQEVEEGEVIALTGDPDLSCSSRPHLHFEVRNNTYHYAYNPVDFIDADWNTLALYGPVWGFQRDLTQPRRWMTPYDQPAIDFWGPMLNNYLYLWPPDWSQ